MQIFRERLEASNPNEGTARRWLWVPYDQLSDRIGPLSNTAPEEIGIVLIESLWRPRQRPYHRQKLALVLANQRHFALEQAERGVAVRYLASLDDYATVLRGVAGELGPLDVMRPAEWELRKLVDPLVKGGLLNELEHSGWLTGPEDFAAAGDPMGPWRQDAFYRAVRKRTGWLMEDGSPVGGKYSHDGDNRELWKGEPPAPEPPGFEPDEITREVVELIEDRFAHHPGRLDPAALPATLEDARSLWEWAQRECMEAFGPYEDAMSLESRGLFHTRISPLVNLHRLLPRDIVTDAIELDIPINSKEGFVRQIAGWREFMRHVHETTDGFRRLDFPVAETPGDAGWDAWAESDWVDHRPPAGSRTAQVDGGVDPKTPGGDLPVLPAWWGTESGMACLDTAARDVVETGWTHHIPRLMVLANLGTLVGISPRALADWFWVAFVDAYDWVTEPNVLAMGSYGVEIMTTKPYISGGAYIDRMSDYCSACAFDPKKNCPVTSMYWAYLDRNSERLAGNRRVALPLASLRKRSEETRAADIKRWERVRERLGAGKKLTPEDAASVATSRKP